MSQLSPYMRAVEFSDAPSAGASWEPDGRTGALHMVAPLTWSGVREYPNIRVRTPGGSRSARILRRPEQIMRPGYLATIKRITPTLGHPQDDNGRSVLITTDNYDRFAVGSVGDTITQEVINGYAVPVGNITVVAQRAIDAIKAGNDQVSQGFFALISPPPEAEVAPDGGVWVGPHGPEEYDYEHICDPDDPRAIAYKQANPEFPLGRVGANHIAVGIPAGRGLAQAQARPVEGYDSAGDGALFFVDSIPAPREVKRVKTKIHCPKFKIPRGLTLASGLPLAIPVFDEMEVEETDSPELIQFLTRLAEFVGMMAQEMAAAQAGAEESTVVAEAAQGEAAVAQAAQGEAVQAAEQAVQAADALGAEIKALRAEVAPLRVQARADAKAIAVKLAPGVVGLDACESVAAIHAAAIAHVDPESKDADPTTIAGMWRFMIRGLDTAAADGAPPSNGKPSPGFMAGGGPGGNPPPSRAAALFAPGKAN